ncbi:MAG TPA: SPOR domain-containing protein [Candidatus Angelobacter sp.]
MGATQDTEITLGTGKLLGIFVLLVAVCAAFFTMGYVFGRGSSSKSASTIVSAVPSAGGNTGIKPSAGGSKSPETTQPLAPDSSSASQAPATLQPTLVPVKADDTAPATPPAELKTAANGSYMVQVAAVSRQEDAEILVNALRKKQYPVLMVGNVPGDSLFHVQVGPFSDPKEAELMRSRLAGDGYNAIVKK